MGEWHDEEEEEGGRGTDPHRTPRVPRTAGLQRPRSLRECPHGIHHLGDVRELLGLAPGSQVCASLPNSTLEDLTLMT